MQIMNHLDSIREFFINVDENLTVLTLIFFKL